MNLLNRYLQDVGRYLPKARRDDIVADLRANILLQIEDREREIGRPMAENELIEMLQHHGNPLIVAGRYREHSLGLAFGIQLIGPELFPFYKTLGLIWGISLVVLAVAMPIVARTIGEKITAASARLRCRFSSCPPRWISSAPDAPSPSGPRAASGGGRSSG